MTTPNGLFEAYVNRNAYTTNPADRTLMQELTLVARATLGSAEVHWAGSVAKGTAIAGSDLDVCVKTSTPVTEAQRRVLKQAFETKLRRVARIHSHVIRLPAHDGRPKLDIAFANAAFGSRPLPDLAPFKNQPARQAAVRAFKLWTRHGNSPRVPGWAVEALVAHLAPLDGEARPLEAFRKLIGWLASKASPAVVEGVLRGAALPGWNEAWSTPLPGQLEALKNGARALLRRTPAPETWTREEDVGRWLGR